MLTIEIPIIPEGWDEVKEEFVEAKTVTLQLEHSLVSLSKWESKWKKPFIDKQDKTDEETIDYIRCMTLTKNVDPDVYLYLSDKNIREVNDYIDDSMTATWFADNGQKKKTTNNRKKITSELIYCWMIQLQIPVEFQKWHLNRLLTLIEVCNEENKTPEKKSKKDIAANYAAMNAARKKALGTKG